jgi:PHD/YefM family antitoxin component YafN of YafNO toxin-antitoxin module
MTNPVFTPEVSVPSAEEIEASLEALLDSVKVITDTIATGDKSEENVVLITRNYQHLEIMLAKDYIQSSGTELFKSVDAIAAAKAFLA